MEITIKEKIDWLVHIINQKKKSIFEWNSKMTCPTYWGHHNDSNIKTSITKLQHEIQIAEELIIDLKLME